MDNDFSNLLNRSFCKYFVLCIRPALMRFVDMGCVVRRSTRNLQHAYHVHYFVLTWPAEREHRSTRTIWQRLAYRGMANDTRLHCSALIVAGMTILPALRNSTPN